MREPGPVTSTNAAPALITRRRILALGAGMAAAAGGAGVVESIHNEGSPKPVAADSPLASAASQPTSPSPSRQTAHRPAGYATRLSYDWAEAAYRRSPSSQPTVVRADGGQLAWGESRALQSYLTMYEATNDAAYLDKLVDHSQAVLDVRDDRVGRRDYLGRSQPGWSAGVPYTVSTVDLRTTSGVAVVRLVVAASAEMVQVEVRPHASERFDLTVRASSGLTESWLGLSTRPQHPRYVVRLLAERFPGTTATTAIDLRTDLSVSADLRVLRAVQMASTRYVFAVHTGMVCTPWARFASLVAHRPDLQGRYAGPAAQLQETAEAAVALHDGDWRRLSDNIGIYAFAVGAPVRTDGTFLPHNQYLALAGCLGYLSRATRNPEYRIRATLMLNLFRSDLSLGSAPSWPYYWSGSKAYRGFNVGQSPSIHSPRMAPFQSVEDVSHGALDVAAVVEGFDAKLYGSAGLLNRLVNTFLTRVLRENAAGEWRTSQRIGSTSARPLTDLAAVGWLPLARSDRRVSTAVSALLDQARPVPKDSRLLWAIAELVLAN